MIRLALLPLFAWSAWALCAIALAGRGPDGIRLTLALVAVVLVGVATWWQGMRGLVLAQLGIDALVTLGFFSLQPSHDRNWTEDQSRLPHATISGDTLTIENLRSFRYQSATEWTPRWRTARYDLRTLEGVDFVVERFTDIEAVAHTLVSFRFEDTEPLAVSIEIRKERGESFSAFKGLFRQYERMIVMGDERDLIELRAVHRADTVYIHPMRTEPDFPRAFLELMVAEAQQIERQPTFYNTLTASCTTGLADHLRAIAPTPWDPRMHLPGYSDALAFERGMIDTEADFLTTRADNQIDERAREAAGTDGFSSAIRHHGR